MLTIKSNRILLEIITEDLDKTPGGIWIPESVQDKRPSRGEVMIIGPDVLNIKPNDVVMFDAYSGVKVELDGKEYLLLREDDIIAIIEEVEFKKERRRRRWSSAPEGPAVI